MSLAKSASGFITFHSLDLSAGEKKSINTFGRVFACTGATSPFRMNFNDGEFFDIGGAGMQWELKEDDRYNRLQFQSETDNDLEFYTGDFVYHQNVVVPVAKVAETVVKYNSTIALAADATLALPGSGIPGYGYRKHLIVHNRNVAGATLLSLTDSDGHPVGIIRNNETNVYETSDDLILLAQFGTANFYIMEIFYPV